MKDKYKMDRRNGMLAAYKYMLVRSYERERAYEKQAGIRTMGYLIFLVIGAGLGVFIGKAIQKSMIIYGGY